MQCKHLQNQRLEEVQIGELDKAAPGWRSTIALSPEKMQKRPNAREIEHDNRFMTFLNEAAVLVAENGGMLRKGELATNKNRVANWLAHQRNKKSMGTLPFERIQRLDHTLPGWQNADYTCELERRWPASLASLVARVKELGRLPRGMDPSAKWLCGQKAIFKEGRLRKDRERALNEAVPGWNTLSSR